MLWLRPSHFSLRTTLFNFHISQWILSLKQSTEACVLHPNQDYLLSLLHEHQGLHQSMQIHCQLITGGFHHDWMDKTGLMICNTLLREHSKGNFPEDALQLYKQMQENRNISVPADSFTFSFLLKACANLSKLDKGIQIHGHIIKVGFEFHVYVQTALINMYFLCRLLSEAVRVFYYMPLRNLVTWNVMITGLTRWGEVDLAAPIFNKMPSQTAVAWTRMIDAYTRINRPNAAVSHFSQMMAEGIKPTEITVLSIIPAISNMGNLDNGKSIHAFIEKNCFSTFDVCIGNSLIDMYAKCSCIENALQVFEEMAERRNLVSWTSMISAFALHGMSREAVEQFKEMKNEGLKPNRVTFLSVLTACSHGGLVEEGLQFFSDMVHESRVAPDIKHYGCMIDMLGRSGRLEEAEKMVNEMPMGGNVIAWRTLLGACSFHGNTEMGERVMAKILAMESGYGGDYVLLSNILAGAGRFDDAERVRRCMDERNVQKVPGLSLIDKKS